MEQRRRGASSEANSEMKKCGKACDALMLAGAALSATDGTGAELFQYHLSNYKTASIKVIPSH